jgi:MFS family permease
LHPVFSSATTLRLVATLSMAYMLSQFLRASLAVIAPELRDTYHLTPAELGSLGGAFFIAFALVQLPLGVFLDRVGPRRVLLSLSVPTIAGALVFATAASYPGFMTGRALMGLGCSAMLMGPLVIYGRQLPKSDFAALTSLHIGIGTIGALLATAPLALAADWVGWRAVFLGAAAAGLVFAVATARVTRKEPTPSGAWHVLADVRGIVDAMRIKGMMAIQPYLFTSYPCVAAVLALWGGPYLTDVYGLDLAERGGVLLLLAGSNTLGYFIIGGVVDRRFSSRKGVLLTCGGTMVGALTLLAIFPGLPLPVSIAALGLVAFMGGGQALLMAHVRALLPDHLLGRGVTIANSFNMLGVAVMQSILGGVAALWAESEGAAHDSSLPTAAYGAMFAVLAALLLVALVIYRTVPDDKSAAASE